MLQYFQAPTSADVNTRRRGDYREARGGGKKRLSQLLTDVRLISQSGKTYDDWKYVLLS